MRTIIPAVLLLACFFWQNARAEDSKGLMQERVAFYDRISKQGHAEKLPLHGRLAELTDRMVKAVSDDEKTALDYFVLGNMAFSIHGDLSFQLMKRADELDPGNPMIAYERAIHEHRRGNCPDAVGYYERFHGGKVGRDHRVSKALLSDCYLRTGQYQAAVTAWMEADHPHNHIGIEKVIYIVYGDQSPQGQRSDLFQQMKSGRTDLFDELVFVDVFWETDWWNVEVNEANLKYDMALAAKTLGTESSEYQELSLFRDVQTGDVDDNELLARMERLGLWGDVTRLAGSPIVNYHIWSHVLRHKLVSEEDALLRLEALLRERSLADGADKYDLDLLAYLYASREMGKLKEVDLFGWQRLGLENYAVSYVVALDPAAREFEETLDAALADFPDAPILAMTKLRRNWDGGNRTALMAAVVAAEFPNVAERKDSYRIKGYMYSLAKEINHPVYAESQK